MPQPTITRAPARASIHDLLFTGLSASGGSVLRCPSQPAGVYTIHNLLYSLVLAMQQGGGGSVASFSFTNANGISGVVTNPTTTPNLTLSLGAITPTSVNGLTITATTGTLTVPNGVTLAPNTVGTSFINLANPSAITFVRINADNSVSALNASDFRTAIGAVGGPGGSNTQLQFNNSSVFGGVSGWTTNGTTTLTGGAGTTLAVGNATIGAHSFAVTGTSLFTGSVTQASGVHNLPAGTAAAPSINFGTADTGIFNGTSSSNIGFSFAGTLKTTFSSTAVWIRDNGGVFILGPSADCNFSRAAANVNGVEGLAGSVQSLSGAGAVNLTTLTTEYTSTGGAQALTLANGVAGQLKAIIHGVDGGSGVLTPTTKTGFTTITFTNVGDSCLLQYMATRGWMILALHGAVAA